MVDWEHVDPKRCKIPREHRLYHIMNEDCPCYLDWVLDVQREKWVLGND